MLPAECSLRLVTELRGALDTCAERQQQLDRRLRGCWRLLRDLPGRSLVRTQLPGSGRWPQKLSRSKRRGPCFDCPWSSKGLFPRIPGLSSGSGLSAAEVEAEVEHLWKDCSLLKLCMRNELAAGHTHWLQEHRCLLILEGLQSVVGQCLHCFQELQKVVAEEQLEHRPSGMPPKASLPCGGEGAARSPQPLLYSSTQELQALTALRLRIAMLDQQRHLQKVLIAELLPLFHCLYYINQFDPAGTFSLSKSSIACPFDSISHSLTPEEGRRVLEQAHAHADQEHLTNNNHPAGAEAVPDRDPGWNYNTQSYPDIKIKLKRLERGPLTPQAEALAVAFKAYNGRDDAKAVKKYQLLAQAINPTLPPRVRGKPAKPLGPCFRCNQGGHWAKECPNPKPPTRLCPKCLAGYLRTWIPNYSLLAVPLYDAS
ncbi:PREDICTED: uncharacterized protein C16orf59 homolog [Chrysochloris asiatica]|uniref:Uncharacterized protein C16orf59 homolog n=1 Tax=Chrysochloris asiatica TaxID=185453 RepID=A0A9B0U116_CHRAS|nr:PREDICTED: uncharacterized protein C16orf59 homolog [Chrysochloris asiatica]